MVEAELPRRELSEWWSLLAGGGLEKLPRRLDPEATEAAEPHALSEFPIFHAKSSPYCPPSAMSGMCRGGGRGGGTGSRALGIDLGIETAGDEW